MIVIFNDGLTYVNKTVTEKVVTNSCVRLEYLTASYCVFFVFTTHINIHQNLALLWRGRWNGSPSSHSPFVIVYFRKVLININIHVHTCHSKVLYEDFSMLTIFFIFWNLQGQPEPNKQSFLLSCLPLLSLSIHQSRRVLKLLTVHSYALW